VLHDRWSELLLLLHAGEHSGVLHAGEHSRLLHAGEHNSLLHAGEHSMLLHSNLLLICSDMTRQLHG
jgi:hypothetical protein